MHLPAAVAFVEGGTQQENNLMHTPRQEAGGDCATETSKIEIAEWTKIYSYFRMLII